MYIRVNAKAGMKKERFSEISENHFEIDIKEKAERNMANKKIIELVANYYNIQTKNVRIVNGHKHPHKLLSIEK